jgi:6-phosphogluconolactonase
MGTVKRSKGQTLRYLVGTYTAGTAAEGIYLVTLDPDTGALSAPALMVGADNPSWLELDGDRLLVANELADGAVSVYAAGSDGLSLEQRVSSHGADPCHLAVGDGRLACANYGGGTVALYEWRRGRIGSLVTVLQPEGAGPHPRQRSPHPHGVYFIKGELWIPDLGTDRIHRHDPGSGTRLGEILIHPGAGPRHLTADGTYLVSELDNTVVTVDGNVAGGPVSTLPEGVTVSNGTAEIFAHGHRIYVSNRGHDSIAVFDTDPDLRLIGQQRVGAHPRHFAIDPTGRWLLVANKDSNDIWSLPIGPDGVLDEPAFRVGCPSPVCLRAWAPDRSPG